MYKYVSDGGNNCSFSIFSYHIINEFKAPFADPRQPRTPINLSISNERLFYLLIDESKRTFKRGLIVTATVSNVLESKAICRLENGLNATIIKEKILFVGESHFRLQIQDGRKKNLTKSYMSCKIGVKAISPPRKDE